jgi:plasmid maintenance system antidote protein VapI
MYILEQMLLDLGWSQAKLAQLMSVGPHTVGRWIREESAPRSVLMFMELRMAMKKLTGD